MMMHRRNAGSSSIVKPKNDWCHGRASALFPVFDVQFEAPFDEAGQGRRDPPAGLLAADVDVTAICVPHEPVAAMPKRAINSSNSKSNRNIPNLPSVLGDSAIGGEPAHTGDVQ